jgi:hypothetical protein
MPGARPKAEAEARRARKARSSAKAPKVIEGVRMDKVNEQLTRKAYRDAVSAAEQMSKPPMKLPDDGKLDAEGLVRELVLWYRATSTAEDLCDCSTCGGDSDARLDACPFCGDTALDEDGDAGPAPEPTPEPTPEPAKGKGGKAKPAKKKLVRKKKPTAAPQAAAKGSGGAKGGKGQGSAKPEPQGRPGASAEVVEAEGVVVVDKGELAEAALDDTIVRIENLKKQAAKGIWDLGMEIKDILDRGMWRLRLDEAGKPRYRTFSAFCKAELGMAYSHANRLVGVATAFPKELMERIGIAKCSIALHVPKEARDKLLEGAESKSKAELSAEAAKLKNSELPSAPKGALTVAMAPGITEIVLHARPKQMGAKKNGEHKPAKSLADDPWGVEQLANKVHVYYAITRNKKGEIVLRIERRRVTKDQLFVDEVEGVEPEEE